MVLYSPELLKTLNHKTLFLDTNVFSVAFRYPQFGEFLTDILDQDCALVTIPSVLFEVTRGSSSLEIYNQRATALKELVTYTDPMTYLSEVDEFSVVMAKLQKADKVQYTDFLLAACLYKYQASKPYLMTTDMASMPKSIFDREFIVTAEHGAEIVNYGIFSLNYNHFEKAATALL